MSTSSDITVPKFLAAKGQGRKLAVPLAQLTPVDPDESTEQAIGDWHYWVAEGYLF